MDEDDKESSSSSSSKESGDDRSKGSSKRSIIGEHDRLDAKSKSREKEKEQEGSEDYDDRESNDAGDDIPGTDKNTTSGAEPMNIDEDPVDISDASKSAAESVKMGNLSIEDNSDAMQIGDYPTPTPLSPLTQMVSHVTRIHVFILLWLRSLRIRN